MHWWLACAALLGGCANVFGLDPVDGQETCYGRNGELGGGLFEACVLDSSVTELLDLSSGVIDTKRSSIARKSVPSPASAAAPAAPTQ